MKHAIHKAIPTLSLLLVAGSLPAAGGHYVVEDAALVGPGECELEAWHTRFDRDSSTSATQLTCNPLGFIDLSGGVTRAREAGAYDTEVELAAKVVFVDAGLSRFGMGLFAAGAYSSESGKVETGELILPITLNLTDRASLHANLGHAYERDDEYASLWGLGIDLTLHQHVSLIAESFGTHRSGTTFHQAGLRFALADLALDISYGVSQANSDQNVVTAGLIWAF